MGGVLFWVCVFGGFGLGALIGEAVDFELMTFFGGIVGAVVGGFISSVLEGQKELKDAKEIPKAVGVAVGGYIMYVLALLVIVLIFIFLGIW
tara:strand:- start:76 stop:351 length:276 start_codon:yes stop_codon:yes gene_type:complete